MSFMAALLARSRCAAPCSAASSTRWALGAFCALAIWHFALPPPVQSCLLSRVRGDAWLRYADFPLSAPWALGASRARQRLSDFLKFADWTGACARMPGVSGLSSPPPWYRSYASFGGIPMVSTMGSVTVTYDALVDALKMHDKGCGTIGVETRQ